MRFCVLAAAVVSLIGCERDKEADVPTPPRDAPTAPAPAPAPGREGTLVTFQNGMEIGRERYTDDGNTLTSEIELGPAKVTVTIPHGTGEVIAVQGGERTVSNLEADQVALENGSWQAYAIAAERFADASSPRAVRVLLPSLDTTVDGTIAVRASGADRVVEVVIKGLVVRAVIGPDGTVKSSEVPGQSLVARPAGQSPPDPTAPRPTPTGVVGEAFELARPDAVLRGDLWLPEGSATPLPIMVIVAGSGPTDRDGNNRSGLATDTYRWIGEGLARRGIASLRYDKRGIGKSTFDGKESEVTMETFSGDVEAIVQALRADRRFSKVVLVGHSEGGLLALLAAQSLMAEKATPIDGLALVASPGRTIEVIVREQLSTKVDAAMMREVDRIFGALRAGGEAPNVPAELAGLFRPSIQPFVRSQLKIDPPKILSSLRVPAVVILQGAMDVQIREADARALAAARPAARLVLLPKANHVLKDEEMPALPQMSYSDPSLPLSNGVIEALASLVGGGS